MIVLDQEQALSQLGRLSLNPQNKERGRDKTKKKWIDDFTLLASIDLKKTLVSNNNPERPVPYRGRKEQILPRKDNILQDEVDSVVSLSLDRKMQLNPQRPKQCCSIH